MPAQRLGVALPTRALPISEALEVALAVEAYGYGEVWTDEVDLADAMTPLAWLAARSDTLQLGVGVVPANTRPVALLGMTAATLQRMSGGRLMLGIGASTPTVVHGWMGLAPVPAVTALSETIEVLRLLCLGETIDFPGETARTTGFGLRGGPIDLPLYVGAHGERTLALAGAVADGVVLGNVGAAWVHPVLDHVRAGAADAGRDATELDVVCRVVVGVGEDADALDRQFRTTVASYASSHAYRAFFTRMGFGEAMVQIARHWALRDGRAAAAAVPDDLLGHLFITGSAESCATQLAHFYDAGVTSLVVVPVSGARDGRRDHIVDGLRALAGAIREIRPTATSRHAGLS